MYLLSLHYIILYVLTIITLHYTLCTYYHYITLYSMYLLSLHYIILYVLTITTLHYTLCTYYHYITLYSMYLLSLHYIILYVLTILLHAEAIIIYFGLNWTQQDGWG